MKILFLVHQMPSEGWRPQEIYNPQREIFRLSRQRGGNSYSIATLKMKKEKSPRSLLKREVSPEASGIPRSTVLLPLFVFLSCLYCFCLATFPKVSLTLYDNSTSHSKKNLITNFALPKQGEKKNDFFFFYSRT